MKTKTQHTPLDIDTLALINRITNEPAFREFAITAVNSHAALLEAAKNALDVLKELDMSLAKNGDMPMPELDQLEQAISQAERAS